MPIKAELIYLQTQYRIFSTKSLEERELIQFYRRLFYTTDTFIIEALSKDYNNNLMPFFSHFVSGNNAIELWENYEKLEEPSRYIEYVTGSNIDYTKQKITKFINYYNGLTHLSTDIEKFSYLSNKTAIFAKIIKEAYRLLQYTCATHEELDQFLQRYYADNTSNDVLNCMTFLSELYDIDPIFVIKHISKSHGSIVKALLDDLKSYRIDNLLIHPSRSLDKNIRKVIFTKEILPPIESIISKAITKGDDHIYRLESLKENLKIIYDLIDCSKVYQHIDTLHPNQSQPQTLISIDYLKQLTAQLNQNFKAAIQDIRKLFRHLRFYIAISLAICALPAIYMTVLAPLSFSPVLLLIVHSINYITGCLALGMSYYYLFFQNNELLKPLVSKTLQVLTTYYATLVCIVIVSSPSMITGLPMFAFLAHTTPLFTLLFIRSHLHLNLHTIKSAKANDCIKSTAFCSIFKLNEAKDSIIHDYDMDSKIPTIN